MILDQLGRPKIPVVTINEIKEALEKSGGSPTATAKLNLIEVPFYSVCLKEIHDTLQKWLDRGLNPQVLKTLTEKLLSKINGKER